MNPQPYLSESAKAKFHELVPMYGKSSDTYELSLLAHSYDQYEYYAKELEKYKKAGNKPLDQKRITDIMRGLYGQIQTSIKKLNKEPEEDNSKKFDL